jgi:ABC-type branched-subunit amino acid transport system ATPase component
LGLQQERREVGGAQRRAHLALDVAAGVFDDLHGVALKQRGYTIVMVEQNFRFAAPLADRFYVMEHGQIVEHFEAAELSEKQDTLNELLGV